ncbi:CPBP family intramembrane glutamic endopeptidase [Undibacterium sp. Ji50W]|uniref:CPBP family intramembrane glutamic endopeptidase n=1 Tax=Undibacterium sp. Ji50W TaxID=3413041 RepID=UPI003BF331E2
MCDLTLAFHNFYFYLFFMYPSTPFVLLSLAVILQRLNYRFSDTVFAWCVGIISVAGVLTGAVNALGLLGVIILALAAYVSTTPKKPVFVRAVSLAVTIVLALAISIHKWPGFTNIPITIDEVLTPGAMPFTLYANLDKGLVGLILLGFFCSRYQSVAELRQSLKDAWLPCVITVALTLGFSVLLGWTRPEISIKPHVGEFLFLNLFVTCIAEEAFFRGLLQQRLSDGLKRFRFGPQISLVAISILFGLAHFSSKIPPPWGLYTVLIATVAGLGYGYVYQKTKRIELSIGLHFALNAIHFLAFTYPAIQH